MGHQPCGHSLFHKWLLVIGEVGTGYEARGQRSVVSVCATLSMYVQYIRMCTCCRCGSGR